jgi:hypothetical protein
VTTIGSPAEVSGYIVTEGAEAVLVPLPATDAVGLAAADDTADTTAVEVEPERLDSPEVIAADTEETEADTSCRRSSGVASTPVSARRGRRRSILPITTGLELDERQQRGLGIYTTGIEGPTTSKSELAELTDGLGESST